MNDPSVPRSSKSPNQLGKSSSGSPASTEPGAAPPVPVSDAAVTLALNTDTSPIVTDPRAPAGYEIERELGRGGMGVVYLARSLALQRPCALKMILAGAHSGSAEVERFRTEARAIARLQHPGIVQVFEIGEHDGRPFMALEYCSGGSLEDKLRANPLPPKDAAVLVLKLAEAVQAAHESKVIHRDLKPGNVLLTERGEPKITDFGLAKRLDEGSTTRTGSVMGTPSYMPPEQAEGNKEIGPAADVYALGAILYECLAGRPPFRAATPLDTLLQVINQEPVPVRQLNGAVPRDLEQIVQKCLQKDPRKRYTTAQELAEDLRRYLEGEPLKARPISKAERVWRWIRRNPRTAALIAGVAASLLSGTVVSTWFAYRAEVNARQAQANERKALRERAQAELARQTAQANERQALEHLWKARLAQARAGRFSGLVGRRFQGLEALKEAASIRPTLEVRNEAIACLALADMKIIRAFEGFPLGSKGLAFDADLQRYARGDEHGDISIRRLADDVELLRLPGEGVHPVVLLFSPDGKYLAVKYHTENSDRMYFAVWDLGQAKEILRENSGIPGRAVAFSKDSRWLAFGQREGVIRLFNLSHGEEAEPVAAGSIPYLYHLAFSPDGCKLAVTYETTQGIIQVREIPSGKILHTLSHPARLFGVDWSPNGESLAAGCANGSIYILDFHNSPATIRHTLIGHQGVVPQVHFNRAGNLLVSRSWDGTSRLWDLVTLRQLVSVPGNYQQISHDSTLLVMHNATQIVLWQIDLASECRALPGYGPGNIAFTHDGRILVAAELEGIRLWDLVTWEELPGMPLGYTRSVLFTPDGKSMITCGECGVYRWPLHTNLTENEYQVTLGPPQPLGPLGKVAVSEGGFLSPDGKTLVVIPQLGQPAVAYDLEKLEHKFILRDHFRVNLVAFSPNGHCFATGTWLGEDIKVWNSNSGELVRTLPARVHAWPLFSPDGRWLASCTADQFRCWETNSWKEIRKIPREPAGDFPGTAAFTKDGKMLAVSHSRQAVRLLHPDTAQEIATLEFPHAGTHWLQCFSPDGSLLVSRHNEIRAIQVWDLRRIRRWLKEVNLDWDLPDYLPIAQGGEAARPLRIEIQFGGLYPK